MCKRRLGENETGMVSYALASTIKLFNCYYYIIGKIGRSSYRKHLGLSMYYFTQELLEYYISTSSSEGISYGFVQVSLSLLYLEGTSIDFNRIITTLVSLLCLSIIHMYCVFPEQYPKKTIYLQGQAHPV